MNTSQPTPPKRLSYTSTSTTKTDVDKRYILVITDDRGKTTTYTMTYKLDKKT